MGASPICQIHVTNWSYNKKAAPIKFYREMQFWPNILQFATLHTETMTEPFDWRKEWMCEVQMVTQLESFREAFKYFPGGPGWRLLTFSSPWAYLQGVPFPRQLRLFLICTPRYLDAEVSVAPQQWVPGVLGILKNIVDDMPPCFHSAKPSSPCPANQVFW